MERTMTINPLDTSNYFKGLLILAGREKQITQDERSSLKKIGDLLGFNHAFIDAAINDFVNNKYIKSEIPQFSCTDIAELFLKDGIKLAFTNNILSVYQIDWLMTFAIENKLSKQWFFIELENYLDNHNSGQEIDFEVQKHMVHTYIEGAYYY